MLPVHDDRRPDRSHEVAFLQAGAVACAAHNDVTYLRAGQRCDDAYLAKHLRVGILGLDAAEWQHQLARRLTTLVCDFERQVATIERCPCHAPAQVFERIDRVELAVEAGTRDVLAAAQAGLFS